MMRASQRCFENIEDPLSPKTGGLMGVDTGWIREYCFGTWTSHPTGVGNRQLQKPPETGLRRADGSSNGRLATTLDFAKKWRTQWWPIQFTGCLEVSRP